MQEQARLQSCMSHHGTNNVYCRSVRPANFEEYPSLSLYKMAAGLEGSRA